MSKSSVINLYDAINGSNHFQVKTFSDKVDFASSTLPLNLKGTQVNLHNADGQVVSDVAGTILSQIAALGQEVSDRQAAVLSETALRISSDSALQTKVDQEVSNRITAVSAEASARTSADSTLQSNISDESSARTAAVAAEASVRSGADAILQFNLDAESAARNVAETTLQSNILQENVARTAAVSAETSARSSADSTLQLNIDQEASNRTAALSAEASARTSVNSTLQSNINSEASARSSADESLSLQITDEKAARLQEVGVERSRIDAMLEGTTVDLDQLKELITAYTTSDNNILTQIGNINTNIKNIQVQLGNTDTKLNTLIEDVSSEPPPPPADFTVVSFSTADGFTTFEVSNDRVNNLNKGSQVRFDSDDTQYTITELLPGSFKLDGVVSITNGTAEGYVVRHADHILRSTQLFGPYNLIGFETLSNVPLSEDQMDAVVGYSFTIGNTTPVFTVISNDNAHKLNTDFLVGPEFPIGSYIYLV